MEIDVRIALNQSTADFILSSILKVLPDWRMIRDYVRIKCSTRMSTLLSQVNFAAQGSDVS